MSKSRTPVFIVCPQCSGTEMAYPARRERRKKDISSWSMVIPFHSQQFTVGQIDRGEWWCSRCDKSAQQSVQPTLLEALPILDKDGELIGTRSVEIEESQSG
jgi:hypothetical protein